MDHLEVELKFYISDLAKLRAHLLELGAECISQRTFEHNVCFDTQNSRLLKNKRLLRLRKDRRTTLTFKSPPSETDSRFKVHREMEVHIDDFEAMEAILNALGFFRRQVYEKRRETWSLIGAMLCLDSMPFGNFLEIEGSTDSIIQIAHDLELRWEQRILANYIGMFAVLQEKEGLAFSDVTFDNFKSVDIPFERYCHLFEAGPGGGQQL